MECLIKNQQTLYKSHKEYQTLLKEEKRLHSPYSSEPMMIAQNRKLDFNGAGKVNYETSAEIEMQIKSEVIENSKTEKIEVEETRKSTDPSFLPGEKNVKNEYYSDNSISLPGMTNAGRAGFEPGMFKLEDDSKSKSDTSTKVNF